MAFTVGRKRIKQICRIVTGTVMHRIRRNTLTNGPCGIPNDMYEDPELFSKSRTDAY